MCYPTSITPITNIPIHKRNRMINIVFMGTPEYAKVILEALINYKEINVTSVFTQPDRPVGRKKVLTPPPVKVLAQEHGIEVFQPLTLKDKEVVSNIKSQKPDFIIVAAYGQILPKAVLDIAPCINLHASILPKYRGASPIQQALLNGDEYSGVTAMLMNEGLDTGDILSFSFVQTSEAPTLDLMMKRLSFLAANLIIYTVEEFDNINPIPQNGSMSSKCQKIKKQDGLVDFSNAQKLYRKYCAFLGWPGIFLENGMKLHGVELLENRSKNKMGEILEINDKYITIGCSKGSIKVEKLQPPSKAKMDAKAYLIGKRLKIGDYLV